MWSNPTNSRVVQPVSRSVRNTTFIIYNMYTLCSTNRSLQIKERLIQSYLSSSELELNWTELTGSAVQSNSVQMRWDEMRCANAMWTQLNATVSFIDVYYHLGRCVVDVKTTRHPNQQYRPHSTIPTPTSSPTSSVSVSMSVSWNAAIYHERHECTTQPAKRPIILAHENDEIRWFSFTQPTVEDC